MLKARILTALALLSSFLLALFFLPAPGWVMLVALAAAGAGREWARLSGLSPSATWVSGLATAVVVGVMGHVTPVAQGMVLISLACVFWLCAAPLWLHFKWPLRGWAGAVLGVVLLGAAGLALIRLRELSAVFLLSLMLLVWVADSAAYFCGRAFGRHKLAAHISPGKTWEGAAGGLVGVLAAGYFLNRHALAQGSPALDPAWILPQLFLLTALSIIGDLFESMMKRAAGFKDSGTLLPGHGGVLDRIDSLLPTLPLGLVLVSLHTNGLSVFPLK